MIRIRRHDSRRTSRTWTPPAPGQTALPGLIHQNRKPITHKGMSLQEKFTAFHQANPHVLVKLAAMSVYLRKRLDHCEINLIFAHLRWLYLLQTNGDDYHLNNNYRAYYARLIMILLPELDGFFALRKQTDEFVPNLRKLGINAGRFHSQVQLEVEEMDREDERKSR